MKTLNAYLVSFKYFDSETSFVKDFSYVAYANCSMIAISKTMVTFSKMFDEYDTVLYNTIECKRIKGI